MASSPLILRVKSAQGQFRLDTLHVDSTVEELLGCLFSLTSVPPASMRLLLSDAPPRPLDCTDPQRRLDALPLRSGDTLIVEARREQPAASVATAKNKKEHHKEHKTLPPHKPAAEKKKEQSLPGVLVKRPVPADNSCLFTSVYLALSSGDYDAGASGALRQVIADCVAADKETYTEAFLGRPNREYCTWILNEEHWGGAIELSVLSRHYRVEMVAVDAQSGRLHRFGRTRTSTSGCCCSTTASTTTRSCSSRLSQACPCARSSRPARTDYWRWLLSWHKRPRPAASTLTCATSHCVVLSAMLDS
ncbi:hypothetical protein MRX96_030249 [Rhipicephalus microplus]